MGVKSIIDIDVNDAGFKNFQAHYEKFNSMLGKQAGMWQKAGTEQSKISAHFQKMTAQLLAQNAARGDADTANRKNLTALTQSDRLWTQMNKTTKGVAANIKDATLSLMKWAGIIEIVSGVLGVGGLFGINRMAANVSGDRNTANSRGMSISEVKAFGNFTGFGLNDSFLDQVADIKGDPTKQRTLGMFGIGNDLSTEDTTVALLKAMRTKAQATPNGMLGLLDQQTGLSVGRGVWQNLSRTGPAADKEFAAALAANAHDAKGRGVDDKTAQGWQQFMLQMDRAKDKLEKVFVQGLAPLEDPLIHLSNAFTGLVASIMGSKGVKDGIEDLAKWIDEFAKNIGSGAFKSAVVDFINGIDDMAKTMAAFAHPMDAVANKFGNPVADWIGKLAWNSDHPVSAIGNTTDYQAYLKFMDHTHGLSDGTLEGVWAHAGGKLGYDPMKLSPQFAKEYGANRSVATDEASAVARYLQENLGKYGGDANKAMAASQNITITLNQVPGADFNATVNSNK